MRLKHRLKRIEKDIYKKIPDPAILERFEKWAIYMYISNGVNICYEIATKSINVNTSLRKVNVLTYYDYFIIICCPVLNYLQCIS